MSTKPYPVRRCRKCARRMPRRAFRCPLCGRVQPTRPQRAWLAAGALGLLAFALKYMGVI